MKIYIIVQGEYDERHICYVTEDKAKADALVDRYNELYPDGIRLYICPYDTDSMPIVTPDSFFFWVHQNYRWYGVREEYTADKDECLVPDTIVATSPEEAIDIFKKREEAIKRRRNDKS